MRHLRRIIALVSFAGYGLLPTAVRAERLEAEKAVYANCRVVSDSRYSGGTALELTEDSASITFAYNAAERGKYTIHVGFDAPYGKKEVNMTVNGGRNGFSVEGMGEVSAGSPVLHAGVNTVVITPSWPWFRIDYLRIEKSPPTSPFVLSPTSVDADATAALQEMYSFLVGQFGKRTISGMMTGDMGSVSGDVTQQADVRAVCRAAGKTPALVGFDFMETTGIHEDEPYNRQYSSKVLQLAKDTYRRGGFPAFCWHWRDPSRKTNEFYTDRCAVRITDAMNADGTWNTQSTLYHYLIKDIDAVADCFLALQREGMACIFSPLHEASGGWFWWGREGARPFVSLYRLLFHEMVVVKGVHNVVWVWNADNAGEEWNPGDEYFDVISTDIYNGQYDYSTGYARFDYLKKLTNSKKLIALSENGPIPDIDQEFDDEAVWSWWMPWYQTWNGNFVSKTSAAEWAKVMGDARCITLESRSAGWPSYTSIFGGNVRSMEKFP